MMAEVEERTFHCCDHCAHTLSADRVELRQPIHLQPCGQREDCPSRKPEPGLFLRCCEHCRHAEDAAIHVASCREGCNAALKERAITDYRYECLAKGCSRVYVTEADVMNHRQDQHPYWQAERISYRRFKKRKIHHQLQTWGA